MGIAKLQQRVIETATVDLRPGERPELASIAMVGPVLTKASVLLGVASIVLTAGTMAMFAVPTKQYLLLTDQRVLFYKQNALTGRPVPGLNGELPRSAVGVESVRRGLLMTAVVLTFPGQEKGLKLSFPLPARAQAREFGALLGFVAA